MRLGYYNHVVNEWMRVTRVSNVAIIEHKHMLNIQDNVFVGHFCFLEASHGIYIGEGCQICSHNVIVTHSSHISIRLYGCEYTKHKDLLGYKKGEIFIGDYSFVGAHCTIMPGAVIGKGSIVKAYSFVKGNFPDFSLISGNPAVIVGDTRDLDKDYLNLLPEKLLKRYCEFSRLNKPH